MFFIGLGSAEGLDITFFVVRRQNMCAKQELIHSLKPT